MAWYTTGAVSVAQNSKTVTGVGTKWADNKMAVGAGQALLIPGHGSVQMYEIASVDSDTKITLVDAWSAASVSNSAYAVMTFYSDSRPDFARRLAVQLAYYQSQMDGWQQIMTGTGSVTLEAPDGTMVTISSFQKLTTDMAGKADKTDLDKKVDKTSLGSAAGATLQTHVADKEPGRVITVGGFGSGISVRAKPLSWEEHNANFSWFYSNEQAGGYAGAGHEAKLSIPTNDGVNDFIATLYANRQASRIGMSMKQVIEGGSQVNKEVWRAEFRTTLNTSVDGNGFIKQASPIARLSDNPSTMTDNYLDGFELSGLVAVNQEAAGVNAMKVEKGVYLISGALGLAKEGWDFEIPQDSNGNRLCFVSTEVNRNGEIMVKVSKRKMDFETAAVIAGEPMDIPAGRWIDFRLEMPINDMEKNKWH